MAETADVQVKFGADASGALAGASEFKGSVQGLEAPLAQLSAAMNSMAKAVREGFAQMSEASEHTRSQMHHDAEEEEAGLMAVAERVKGVGESLNRLKATVSEFAEVWIAAFGIEKIAEWAEKNAEAAERTEQLAQKVGMSAEQIQEWGAVAIMTGHNQDAFVSAITRLEHSAVAAAGGAKQQSAALRDLGISAQAALNPQELILEIADRFKEMPDGPRKTADAMALMGRAGAEMIPILNGGREAIEEMTAKGREYGAVMGEEFTAKGAALAESFNTQKIAIKGLQNVMFDEMAPAIQACVDGFNSLIKSFVQSYEHGGTAKQMMDALAVTFKALATLVEAGGTIIIMAFKMISAEVRSFGDVWDIVKRDATTSAQDLGDRFNILKAAIWEVCESLKVELKNLGQIIADVFTLNWGAIAGDWQAGMDRLKGVVAQASKEVQASTAKIGERDAATGTADQASAHAAAARMLEAGKSALGTWNAGGQWLHRLWDGDHVEGGAKRHGGDESLGELGKAGPDSGKDKEPKSRVPEWENKFQKQEMDQGNANPGVNFNETADAAKYWADILAKQKLTKAEQLEVDKKYYETVKQLRTADIADTLADAQSGMQSAIRAAEDRLRVQTEAINEQIAAVRQADKEGEISHSAALERIKALIGEEVEAVKQAAAEKLKAQVAYDQAVMAHNAANTEAFKKAQHDMQAAYEVFQSAMTAADTKGNKDRAAADRNYEKEVEAGYKKIADSIRTNLEGMLFQHQTFLQTVEKLFEGLVDKVLVMGEKMVLSHFTQETAKTGATAAGVAERNAAEQAGHAQSMIMSLEAALKQIANDAAKAASGAYQALVGIPIIGPVIAPVGAAAAFAGVMAFEGLASAEGGFDIPSYANPLTQLHASEMVLPASIANPLRAMIAGGDGSGQSGSQSGGGDTYHIAINSADAKSVERLFMDHGDALVKSLRRQHRNLALA